MPRKVQDAGIGQAGDLWFADGASCGTRVAARSGVRSRRGSGSAVVRLTPFALSNAAWRALPLFPPRLRKTFHKAILGETLPERCVSSRHRINPRGVKRKMSTFPLRPRKRHPTQRTVPLIRIRGRYRKSIVARTLAPRLSTRPRPVRPSSRRAIQTRLCFRPPRRYQVIGPEGGWEGVAGEGREGEEPMDLDLAAGRVGGR